MQKRLLVKRNVWALGIVSLLTDISSEMVFSVLPVFMSSVLMLDKALIGLIEGVAESSASVSKLLAERTERLAGSRKRAIILGYGISTLLKPFFAVANLWWQVLVFRTGDRIGKGLRGPPRDAIIANSVSDEERGFAFGLHRAMDTTGAVIGPILAFLILSAFSGRFDIVFLSSFVPAALALIVIWLFVKERRVVQEKKEPAVMRGSYRWFLASASLFALGNLSFAFLLIRVQELGVALELIPLAYLMYTIPYALAAIPFGRLADRIGRSAALSVSLILFALVFSGFAFVSDITAAIFLLALYGVSTAGTDTIQRIIASELVPKQRRTGSLGTYQGITGMLAFPASLVAGVLWSGLGHEYAFGFAALMSLLALAALTRISR